jgi:hypothetical protein
VHPALWPALRISAPPPSSFGLRFLRRLAFDWPRLGNALLGLSSVALDWLERVRWRGTWRSLHAATMYYAYWRGAVVELGGGERCRAALVALGDDCRRRMPAVRELEIDLADGLTAAEALVEAERPDAIRVRFGEFRLGRIPEMPGYEALAGRHLRRQIAEWLDRPLGVALALSGARAAPTPVEASFALTPGS